MRAAEGLKMIQQRHVLSEVEILMDDWCVHLIWDSAPPASLVAPTLLTGMDAMSAANVWEAEYTSITFALVIFPPRIGC